MYRSGFGGPSYHDQHDYIKRIIHSADMLMHTMAQLKLISEQTNDKIFISHLKKMVKEFIYG